MLHVSGLIVPVHVCVCSLQGNIVLHPKCVTVSFVISVSVVTFVTRRACARRCVSHLFTQLQM